MAKNIYIFFFKFQIDSKGLETHSLRRKANARNVSFETLYRGQFTLSTHLIKPEKKKSVGFISYGARVKFLLQK